MGLAFSPDGCCLATACVQPGEGETWANIRAIDSGTGPLHVPNREPGDAISFTPDAESLATASEDKTFHVSPLRFDDLYETATRLQSETSPEAR